MHDRQPQPLAALVPAVSTAFICALGLAVVYRFVSASLAARMMLTYGARELPLTPEIAAALIVLVSTALGIRVFLSARQSQQPSRKRPDWR